MGIPTYTSKKRRHMKFNEATEPYAVRLPKSVISIIKENDWDIGQLIFNIVNDGLTPSTEEPKHPVVRSVAKKIIQLMIEHEIQAPEGMFTAREESIIITLAEEAGS